MDSSFGSVVLFAKNHAKVAAFYAGALGMQTRTGGADHSVLEGQGFAIVVQQIPQHIAAEIQIEDPPIRRTGGAIRLDFTVTDIEDCRGRARKLGGYIDETPPVWASEGDAFFLGCDPEGNVIGVSAAQP